MNQLLHVSSSPHIKDKVTTSSIMLDVVIALLPATFFGICYEMTIVKWKYHISLIFVFPVL